MSGSTYDVVIIGGGIVGLATALAVSEQAPELHLAILDKESRVARHQTMRNSMILHSGVYYRPGSYKAAFCVASWALLTAFCDAHDIPWRRCTKLVVGTAPRDREFLNLLLEQGRANGVPGLELIGPERIREHEPAIRGSQALFIPRVATLDYLTMAQRMADLVTARGAALRLETRVERVERRGREIVCETSRGAVSARYLVNCSGLQADRIARLAGVDPGVSLIPFRIMRFLLKPQRTALVRSIIYQVPEPGFPAFGVHITRRFDDEIELGPGVALALAREGYTPATISLEETSEMLRYRGFWALLAKKWRVGLVEHQRAFSKTALVRELQRMLPEITGADVLREPTGDGILAPAFTPDGEMLDDFHLVENAWSFHVVNAPSPAATAALALGRHVAHAALRTHRVGKPRPVAV